MAVPLYKLAMKGTDFEWTAQRDEALSALVVGVRLATRSIVVNSWSWVKRHHRGVCRVGGTLLHNDHEIKYYTGIDFTQTFRISLFLYII